MLISAGIVFEVQKAHRDLDPPVEEMMVVRPGPGVKNSEKKGREISRSCHELVRPFL
jgi:hypothetical protein